MLIAVAFALTLSAAPPTLPPVGETFESDCAGAPDNFGAMELAAASAFVGVTAMAIGPSVYLAQADVPPLEEAPSLIAELVQAVRDKDWQAVTALAIMLLVLLANTVLLKFGLLADEARKVALPWIAAGSGCLLVFSATLIGGGSWWQAAIAGFITGAAATGLWELVGKHVRKALKKKSPEG